MFSRVILQRILQLTLKIWYSFEELDKTFNGFNAVVWKTYVTVTLILPLKVHEKEINENCVIKFILKEQR